MTGKSHRDAYLRRVYGLTEEDYEGILLQQGGGCAICGKTPEQEGQKLAVDHCHKPPYQVRGVLCRYCNHRVIGRHHDGELLRRMAEYVERDLGFIAPPKPKNRRRRTTRKAK